MEEISDSDFSSGEFTQAIQNKNSETTQIAKILSKLNNIPNIDNSSSETDSENEIITGNISLNDIVI